MSKTKKAKVKRIVLGVGHPWFVQEVKGPGEPRRYHSVRLYPGDGKVARSIDVLPLDIGELGSYNKIRLVAEVIK